MLIGMKRWNALTLLIFLASSVMHAGDDALYNWRCPYTPDGSCPPSRQTYGHYATKWNRWPGVTNADYESKIKKAEPTAPQGPSATAPRETPEDLLLPPDPDETRELDNPPAPPRGEDNAPPPLTPEAEARPDILTPPGEDIMEELLPEEPPKRPEPAPKTPTKPTPPSAKEPSTPPTKKPSSEPSPDPTPEPTPESDQPFDDDPFKDDPLFEDEPPAPPSGTKRSGIDGGAGVQSPAMSALRSVPASPPTAPPQAMQWNRPQPQSRLSRAAASTDPRPMPSAPGAGKSAMLEPQQRPSLSPLSTSNPLRSDLNAEVALDDQVIPTAAWEEASPAEPAPESNPDPDRRANPLRP